MRYYASEGSQQIGAVYPSANTRTLLLVIDAGWCADRDGRRALSHGDWIPSERLFPHGLGATARAIRERGLVPGL